MWKLSWNRVCRWWRDGPNAVQVDVLDQGIGIQEPEKVFEPFFTTKVSGMGLGLAICRSIAKAHDGRLWVASSDGSGTTISLALPIGREGVA